MAFPKGVSGNPKGRPRKGKTLTEALQKATTPARRKALAEAAYDLALGHWQEEITNKGARRIYFVPPELPAINFLFERLDGKVATKVEIALILRRAAEAHGLAPDDPRVLAAIAEAEAVVTGVRG